MSKCCRAYAPREAGRCGREGAPGCLARLCRGLQGGTHRASLRVTEHTAGRGWVSRGRGCGSRTRLSQGGSQPPRGQGQATFSAYLSLPWLTPVYPGLPWFTPVYPGSPWPFLENELPPASSAEIEMAKAHQSYFPFFPHQGVWNNMLFRPLRVIIF